MNINRKFKLSYNTFLFLIFFFTGCLSILSQTIILRELFSVIHGTEVIFGFCFFFWMMGGVCGALCGRKIKSHQYLILVTSLLLLGCFSLLSVCFVRVSAGFLYSTFNIPMFKIMTLACISVLPVSFFSGLAFPAASLATRHSNPYYSDTLSISSVYIYESLGALSGGFIFTFFLISRFNSLSIITLNGLILFLTLLIFFHNKSDKPTYTVLVGLFIFLVGLLFSHTLNNLTEKIKWVSINSSELVTSGNTPYCHFGLFRTGEQFSLYINGSLSDTFPDQEKHIIQSIQIVCQGNMPETVLILGNGYTGLAQALLKFNVKKVDIVVEDYSLYESLLPVLPESLKSVRNIEKIKVIDSGIKPFIRNKATRQYYDAVVYALPEPDTLALNSYYTEEFFLQVKQVMKPEGILMLNTRQEQSYLKGNTGNYISHLYSVLKKEFSHFALSPGSDFLLFSGNESSTLTENPDILKNRFIKFSLKPDYLSNIFYSEYPEHNLKQIHSFLDNTEHLPVNTNDRPVLTQLLTVIHGFYHSPDTGRIFETLLNVSEKTLAGVFLMPFLFSGFVKLIKKKGFRKTTFNRGFFMVFSAGCAGLVAEIVIICLFQFHFGYTYKFIGLISALFMAGLPAGAYMSSSKNFDNKNITHLYILFILNILLIILVHRIPLPSSFLLLSLLILTFTTGFFTGTFFPVSLALYSKIRSQSTAHIAGVIDTLDHAGGAAGALFTGIFLSSLGFTLSLFGVIIILSTSMFFFKTDSI